MSPQFLYHFACRAGARRRRVPHMVPFHCRRRRKESWSEPLSQPLSNPRLHRRRPCKSVLLNPMKVGRGCPQPAAKVQNSTMTATFPRTEDSLDRFTPPFSNFQFSIPSPAQSIENRKLKKLLLRCWKLDARSRFIGVGCSMFSVLQPATFNLQLSTLPPLRRSQLSTLNFFNEVPL